MRFAEEAIELVQSVRVSRDILHSLIDYVYDREVGESSQEIGGVLVTLLALASNLGVDAHKALHEELTRISTLEMMDKIRRSQNRKAQAGFGVPYKENSLRKGIEEILKIHNEKNMDVIDFDVMLTRLLENSDDD